MENELIYNLGMRMQLNLKATKFIGGLICTIGGVYIGNGYGASYWRFVPFDLGWDTLVRGSLLVAVGFLLIAISK